MSLISRFTLSLISKFTLSLISRFAISWFTMSLTTGIYTGIAVDWQRRIVPLRPANGTRTVFVCVEGRVTGLRMAHPCGGTALPSSLGTDALSTARVGSPHGCSTSQEVQSTVGRALGQPTHAATFIDTL